jgi:hypothetical protein
MPRRRKKNMGSGRGHVAFATAERKGPFGGKDSATEPPFFALLHAGEKGARGARWCTLAVLWFSPRYRCAREVGKKSRRK